LLLLRFLVIEFTPVDDFGDRRLSVRGNLNKIKLLFFGKP
jgi:hypothetical protein